MIGVAVRSGAARPDFGIEQGRDPSGVGSRRWPCCCLALHQVLPARHWSPFNFRGHRRYVPRAYPGPPRIRSASYLLGEPIDALSEALTETLLGVPVGVLSTCSADPAHGAGQCHHVHRGRAETGAVNFRDRRAWAGVPCLTVSATHDVLLGALGTCCGAGAALVLSGAVRPKLFRAALSAWTSGADCRPGSSAISAVQLTGRVRTACRLKRAGRVKVDRRVVCRRLGSCREQRHRLIVIAEQMVDPSQACRRRPPRVRRSYTRAGRTGSASWGLPRCSDRLNARLFREMRSLGDTFRISRYWVSAAAKSFRAMSKSASRRRASTSLPSASTALAAARSAPARSPRVSRTCALRNAFTPTGFNPLPWKVATRLSRTIWQARIRIETPDRAKRKG